MTHPQKPTAAAARQLLTVIFAIAALVTAAAAAKKQFGGRITQPHFSPSLLPDWKELITVASGLPAPLHEGQLVLLAFIDYACDSCGRLAEYVESLEKLSSGRIAVGYLHFPQPALHPSAYKAAIAAECAQRQGKFRAFHMSLFDTTVSTSDPVWRPIASRVGLDLRTFKSCLESDAPRRVVERHVMAARQAGLRATPVFVLNGTILPAATDIQRFVDSLSRTKRSTALD